MAKTIKRLVTTMSLAIAILAIPVGTNVLNAPSVYATTYSPAQHEIIPAYFAPNPGQTTSTAALSTSVTTYGIDASTTGLSWLAGDEITIWSGSNEQEFTLSEPASYSGTILYVDGQTASYAFPSGSSIGDFGAQWSQLLTATAGGPSTSGIEAVIANPASGPDYEANAAPSDDNWSGVIAAEAATGHRVLGYVNTGFLGTTGLETRNGSTSTEAWRDQAEQDVEAWYNFYPGVDGIFFDQGGGDAGSGSPVVYSPSCGSLDAYSDEDAALSEFVTDNYPGALTVLNPGSNLPSCYSGSADVINIYEGTWDCYEYGATGNTTNLSNCEYEYGYAYPTVPPEAYSPPTSGDYGYTDGGTIDVNPNSVMSIVYDAIATGSSDSTIAADAVTATKSQDVGYTDITNQSGSNPYDLLSDSLSTIQSDEPGSGDSTTPSAPDTVDTYDVQYTTAQLNWGAATDTDGSGVVAYDVYVQNDTTSSAYYYVGSTTIADYLTPDIYLTGLTINDEYTARVYPRNLVGTLGSYGSKTWTQESDDDSEANSAPVLATPTASYSNVSLSWSAATGGEYPVAFYWVFEDGYPVLQVPSSVTTTTVIDSNSEGTNEAGSLPFSTLTPDTSHSFYIVAIDTAGNPACSNSNTETVTTDSIPGNGNAVQAAGTWSYSDTGNLVVSANVYEPYTFIRLWIDSDDQADTGDQLSWDSSIGADYFVESDGGLWNFFVHSVSPSTGFDFNQNSSPSTIVPAISGTEYTWTIPASDFTTFGPTSVVNVSVEADGFAPLSNADALGL